MKLHQLLRMIHDGCNIIIFNLQGIQILSVRNKSTISTDLYDYDVSEINVGLHEKGESAFYITLSM